MRCTTASEVLASGIASALPQLVPTIVQMVVQICQTLGIKAISSDASFYLTEDTQQLLDQYAQLDDYGRHTIASVMKVEYDRCSTQGARSTSGSDYELRPSVNVSSDLGGSSVEPLQVLSDHHSL